MIGVWLCMAALVVLLGARWRGAHPGVAAGAKTLASAGFLLAGWQFGALGSVYGRLLMLGLSLCALGDVLLIPRDGRGSFRAGIGAFLLGHLAYAGAFLEAGVASGTLLAAGLVVAALGWAVLRWLGPHVPYDFQGPVRVYVGAIGAMVACSIGAVSAGSPTAVGVGAVGFALSDLAVARDRFVAPGFANGAWGLPLYYASQLLLASTAAA